MKLNLLFNNAADARSGYINVDPMAPEDDKTRTRCDLHNLEPVVDANEVSELVAHDLLDRYSAEEVDQVLDHWLSRLAHGGQLVISVVDFRDVARAFLLGNIDMEKVNALIHGENGLGRRCCLTANQLKEVIQNKGLRVLSFRYNEDYRIYIVVQRP